MMTPPTFEHFGDLDGWMQIVGEFGNYKEAFLALLIIFERIILMIIDKWVVAIRCYLDGKDYFCHNGHISYFISSIDVVCHWETGKFGYKFPKMRTMLSMSIMKISLKFWRGWNDLATINYHGYFLILRPSN